MKKTVDKGLFAPTEMATQDEELALVLLPVDHPCRHGLHQTPIDSALSPVLVASVDGYPALGISQVQHLHLVDFAGPSQLE